MAKDRSDEQVAYHEAGHAVLAWVFGIDLESVTAVAGADYLGVAKTGSLDSDAVGYGEYEEEPEHALLSAHAHNTALD